MESNSKIGVISDGTYVYAPDSGGTIYMNGENYLVNKASSRPRGQKRLIDGTGHERITAREALEMLKNEQEMTWYRYPALNDAIKSAIAALEKQIPQKPNYGREQTSLFGEDDISYCPRCTSLLPEGVNYCEVCGQRILWEDE